MAFWIFKRADPAFRGMLMSIENDGLLLVDSESHIALRTSRYVAVMSGQSRNRVSTLMCERKAFSSGKSANES